MRSGNNGGSKDKGLRALSGTIYTTSRTRFPHLHVFLSSLVNIFASFTLCSFIVLFCLSRYLSLSLPSPTPLSISVDFVTLYRNSMISPPPPPPFPPNCPSPPCPVALPNQFAGVVSTSHPIWQLLVHRR